MSSSSGTEDSTSSEENEETQVSLAKSPSRIQKDLIIMKICNIILIIYYAAPQPDSTSENVASTCEKSVEIVPDSGNDEDVVLKYQSPTVAPATEVSFEYYQQPIYIQVKFFVNFFKESEDRGTPTLDEREQPDLGGIAFYVSKNTYINSFRRNTLDKTATVECLNEVVQNEETDICEPIETPVLDTLENQPISGIKFNLTSSYIFLLKFS